MEKEQQIQEIRIINKRKGILRMEKSEEKEKRK